MNLYYKVNYKPMKHRIVFFAFENLYRVQSKSLFSGWKIRDGYFYTDSKGNLKRTSGFTTYSQAEDWLHDRYPGLNLLNAVNKNENIGFEF